MVFGRSSNYGNALILNCDEKPDNADLARNQIHRWLSFNSALQIPPVTSAQMGESHYQIEAIPTMSSDHWRWQ
jgi:hypothetical protein